MYGGKRRRSIPAANEGNDPVFITRRKIGFFMQSGE